MTIGSSLNIRGPPMPTMANIWPMILPGGNEGSECPEDVQGFPRVNRVYRGCTMVNKAVQGFTVHWINFFLATVMLDQLFLGTFTLDQLFLAAFMLDQLSKPSYSLVKPRFPRKPSLSLLSSEPSEHLVTHLWPPYIDWGIVGLGPRDANEDYDVRNLMISILTIGLRWFNYDLAKWPSDSYSLVQPRIGVFTRVSVRLSRA